MGSTVPGVLPGGSTPHLVLYFVTRAFPLFHVRTSNSASEEGSEVSSGIRRRRLFPANPARSLGLSRQRRSGTDRRVSRAGGLGGARGVSGGLRGGSPNLGPHFVHIASSSQSPGLWLPQKNCTSASEQASHSPGWPWVVPQVRHRKTTPLMLARSGVDVSGCIVASLLGITAANVRLRDVEPIDLRQRAADPARDRGNADERPEQLPRQPRATAQQWSAPGVAA